MNAKQRKVLAAGCVIAALMFLVPPWVVGKVTVYAPAVAPPSEGHIASQRLFLQFALLTFLALGAFLATGKKKKREPPFKLPPDLFAGATYTYTSIAFSSPPTDALEVLKRGGNPNAITVRPEESKKPQAS